METNFGITWGIAEIPPIPRIARIPLTFPLPPHFLHRKTRRESPIEMAEMSCDLAPDQMKTSSAAAVGAVDGEEGAFNASEHFFEGAEKLLEMWFAGHQPGATLRAIPERELRRLVEMAGCKILQALRAEQIDAYLLSESSLFVSDRRLILKTCGQTRPLLVIAELIELARKYANMDIVTNVYYSRKNFFRPQLQPQLHATFDEEINYLDAFFQGGTAYCMGPLKHDRWYLYTLNTPRAPLNCSDHTLELQMTGIPAEFLRVYSWDECPSGAEECTRRSGIMDLIPDGTLVQDELFRPVGYSMNGVPARDEYVTIHVTPEPQFCYVSFETNHRRGCLYEQTMRVLGLYRPGRFILTLFANEQSAGAQKAQQRLWKEEIGGYKRMTVQMLRLQYDTLLFALYVREEEGDMPMDPDRRLPPILWHNGEGGINNGGHLPLPIVMNGHQKEEEEDGHDGVR